MIDTDRLQRTLKELDEAVLHHEHWHRQLMRALVCGLEPDPRDLDVDSHRHCRFGGWYSSVASQGFHNELAFASIGRWHAKLHRRAAAMLATLSVSPPIQPAEYDRLARARDRFHARLTHFRHVIEDRLYHHDALTGADSRIDLISSLRAQMALVERRIHACSIAMVDVDHFKRVNDACGHAAGDQVLAGVVRTIRSHLRPYDRVFRYGGEEFLVVLPATDEADALMIAERIRQAMSLAPMIDCPGAPVSATASFGVTRLDSEVGIEESIARADRALYDAKVSGRNRVRLWDGVETDSARLHL